VKIVIDPNGEMRTIATPEAESLGLGSGKRRRASYIEPANRPLRWLFRRLRRMFGDYGRVAAFTRSWPCEWRVDLTPSAGPIVGGFHDRAEAIRFEVRWLEKNSL
jgi:hypothetical protein